MSLVTVHFLEKEYSIPADVITYVGLVDFTNEVKGCLLSSFSKQITHDVAVLERSDFMVKEINDQVSKFIAKLLANDIYDKTANDYLRNNKGYDLFGTTKQKILRQIVSIRKEKLETYRAGVQDAISQKEASVTGLDFGIISSSFVNHMIYAYMDASKQTKQEKEALEKYNREIAALRQTAKAYDEQEKNYIINNAIPAMNTVFTYFAFELLDRYVSDLIRTRKFDKAALKYIDLERSNDLLKNLELAGNKMAVIENAFVSCPFNIAVYMNAMKHNCLDYTSFQTAVVFKQGEKILTSLRESLGNSSNSQKRRLNFRSAELLSIYTNTPMREITSYMADFVFDDGYAKTIALLSDKKQCRNVLQKENEAEILSGDKISKQKAAWLVDPIAPPALWDKLTTICGHNDLLNRIITLLPDGSNITTKEQLDAYLKEKLYEAFEIVRKELAAEIREQEAAQLAYERSPKTRLKKFWLKNNMRIVIGVVVLIVIIWLANGPKTVDSGGGWSHQVDDFNKLCDSCRLDGEEEKATHRIHAFLYNDYYCDECWDSYGENFYEKLKEK